MKPFFDVFTIATDPNVATPAIATLLLHETAHLFGLGDADAEAFAHDVQEQGFIPLLSNSKNFCDDLSKIPTSYDPAELTSCYQSVHAKFCSEGTPVDAILAQKFGDAIADCTTGTSGTTWAANARSFNLMNQVFHYAENCAAQVGCK